MIFYFSSFISFVQNWAHESERYCEKAYASLTWTSLASLEAQMVKNLPAAQETRVRSLGQEDPLEKVLATHSSILAWRIPWTEEPDGLQSMGSHRVGHDWATNTFFFTYFSAWTISFYHLSFIVKFRDITLFSLYLCCYKLWEVSCYRKLCLLKCQGSFEIQSEFSLLFTFKVCAFPSVPS